MRVRTVEEMVVVVTCLIARVSLFFPQENPHKKLKDIYFERKKTKDTFFSFNMTAY